MDALFHRLHDEESEKIDCLQCANCCRSLGPRFIQNDIARMATHLK
ncbi:MAG: YkgJ family cysteine cluster protein, partial [Bacteroidales bacterium]|nr:YkgJ family cysteine cluster protein [Bacteroidales bacterium]